jgi:hypothetical protein
MAQMRLEDFNEPGGTNLFWFGQHNRIKPGGTNLFWFGQHNRINLEEPGQGGQPT